MRVARLLSIALAVASLAACDDGRAPPPLTDGADTTTLDSLRASYDPVLPTDVPPPPQTVRVRGLLAVVEGSSDSVLAARIVTNDSLILQESHRRQGVRKTYIRPLASSSVAAADSIRRRIRTPPETVIVEPPPDTTPPPPDTVVAPPPSDPADTSTFAKLLGPYISIDSAKALGGDFAEFEAVFAEFADYHWARNAGFWESCYYDCALHYYAAWARSGPTRETRNPVYLQRARQAALSMRRDYWEKQPSSMPYNQNDYWHMPMGVALHYLESGDDSSRLGVAYTAGYVTAAHRLASASRTEALARPPTYTESPAAATFPDPLNVGISENRFRGRGIQAAVLAHIVNGPKDGPANGYGRGGPVVVTSGTWCEVAGKWVDASLATQHATGSWRDKSSGGAAKPFMDAILTDALVLYYQFCAADPRIVDAVRRNADYLWANVWLGHETQDAAMQAFGYYEYKYTDPNNSSWAGSRSPAGDLSLMSVNTWGWLYSVTGDVKYKTQGDQIFASGVRLGYKQGAKQFNQMFYGSWRYLGYRQSR